MIKYFFILAIMFCLSVKFCWSGEAIIIDGLFDDWISVTTAYSDPFGDGDDEDFMDLKITNDNDFLFLNISFYKDEHLLQNFNELRLYIDTDNDNQTGYLYQGIGVDLEWCFGCRQGTYYSTTGSKTLWQNDIVLRNAPTVTSKNFEIALSLNSIPMTLSTLQKPDTIAIALNSSDAVDNLPDLPGGVIYTIDSEKVESLNPIPLKREHQQHVRVLSYNTLGSGIVYSDRQEHFRRIIQALQPDIMAFQEQAGGRQVTSLVADWFQMRDLYSAGLGNNNLVVSKFPILHQALITASERTMAVLLQTESVLGANLLVLNSHLACCTNDESRQFDADEVIMVLRHWRDGHGPFPLPANTPIIHLGDFNLVGSSQQLKTLTEGDIADELHFGNDFPPDWDNSALADLFSRHTSIRMGYTWRDDQSSFSPGKLDYILFTDSVIEPGNHFVLNTLAMSDSELDKYGLLSDDTILASDHLPRIMDIASVKPISVQDKVYNQYSFQLFQSYPNPCNSYTVIPFELSKSSNISLIVYNIIGEEIFRFNDKMNSGKHIVKVNLNQLPSGVYFYTLKSGIDRKSMKFLLIE